MLLPQMRFRNQGGFHMICSGRDKIETQEDLQKTAEAVSELNLDGLVVAGGDDSNTNAAVLAEFFLAKGASTIPIVSMLEFNSTESTSS